MAQARKKPVVIDYFDYRHQLDELNKWVTEFGDNFHDHFLFEENPERVSVKTLEGTSYELTDKHMIVRGVAGEYYPCDREIFWKTYEQVN